MTSKVSQTYRLTKGSAEEWTSFDELSDGLAVARLPAHWLDEVALLSTDRISADIAATSTMQKVLNHNADAFFGMFTRRQGEPHALLAYFAQLLLNERGYIALVDRNIDLKNPPLDFLARTGERPAAVYVWGIVAPRRMAIFQPYLRRKLTLLAGVPHFATLSTAAGLHTGLCMGLTPVAPDPGRIGDLFKFPPAATVPEHQIEVRTVASAEAFEQARAVRAAVFMQEQLCPYNEEFDGNDYSAQHILGLVDGAPAATIRIRYFATFAKLERFAVLTAFRKTDVKDEVIRFALELVARKGYREVYGHAQERLIPFWKRRGFERIDQHATFRFSNYDYVEIRRELPAHKNALSIRSDAMVLNRVEGTWDVPGILEGIADSSLARPAA